MIVHNVQQGSAEWHAIRCGIPTASNFHKLITPKTRKPSASAEGYMHELIAERILGQPINIESSGFMERGKELEPEAVNYYAMMRDCDPQVAGFVTTDDRSVGCSPDRLIGVDGGLEIKCPGPAEHVANMLGMTEKYYCQVQGCMWLCERQWWDLVSYHPQMPAAISRIERDDEFVEQLATAIVSLNDRMEAAMESLRVFGVRYNWRRSDGNPS